MSEGPPTEVIGQGREPDGSRPLRRPLSRGMRATGYLLLAVLGAGGLWLTARPQPAPAAAGGEPAVPVTITVYPSPDETATLPAHHDLSVSALPGERSFIAFSGHILLFLTLSYAGTAPVRVVDGRVPQDGAFADDGASGLTAGTTDNVALRKGVPTEVFIRTRVDCDVVLEGPPVDQLDLITQPAGASPREQIIDVSALGAYWDEARHAACSKPDARTSVIASVGAETVHGYRPANGGRPWIEAVASLHNSAGFDAVVMFSGASSPALSFVAPAMTSAGAAVDGGSTYGTPVRWVISDCAAAGNAPAPALPMNVVVSESHAEALGELGSAFARVWRDALLQACG
jgi:hypothetical protein